MTNKQIVLANPRGFCAGVERAILIVERLLEHFGKPIYVRHEIVHNRYVVDDLRARGVVFINELHEVPDDAVVIFSAHGVTQQVEDEAKRRKLSFFDSTCPLVSKVHLEVNKAAKKGDECILVGHANHPEVEGTIGRFNTANGGRMYLVENSQQAKALQVNNPNRLHLVTQTTLSVDDTSDIIDCIKERFPAIHINYKDICYATQNRQNAVKELVSQIDVLIVVGSPNSSNSNRLCEIASQRNIDSYLVDDQNQIKDSWFVDKYKVGVTAGASAPDSLVNKIIERLIALGYPKPKNIPKSQEKVFFPLPKSVQQLTIH